MAKKDKSAKLAKVTLPQPMTSPYTSPPVTLHFGPDRQVYYLPDVLLQSLRDIPCRDPWTGQIHLADVDASIGHVLIHFLQTGVYQTLNDEDAENAHGTLIRNEFQTAVLALEAATKYSVPGLQELAQIELERRGKEMCLRDAVRAIREEFIAGSPDEHTWLRDYVLKKVRWTFEHDPETLSAPGFFGSIESPTLTQLLAQIIVGLYSEEVDKLRKVNIATGKLPTPEHSVPTRSCSSHLPTSPSKLSATTSTSWPAAVESFGAFDDSVAARDPYNLGQDQSNKSEASALAALSPYGKRDKKELDRIIEVKAAAEESVNVEARAQEEDLTEIKQFEEERGTIAQLQEQDVAAASSAATKEEPDRPESMSTWSGWGGASGKKMKAKKLKRKLEKKAKMQQEEEAHDIGLQKEEEIRRLEEEEAAAVAAAEAAAEVQASMKSEEDIWDEWGATSTVTKKKKKSKEAEGRIQEDEEEAAAATAAEAGVSVFDSAIEMGVTSNDDECELRLDHLSQDDGWQNCKPCKLYLRTIAMKHYSVGHRA